MDKRTNFLSLLTLLAFGLSSCANTTPTHTVTPAPRSSVANPPASSATTTLPNPATRTTTPTITQPVNYQTRGNASWYDLGVHGMKTASGEVYDLYKMTAAHATLPLYSRVQVTSLQTGQSVIVTINDRLTDNQTNIRLAYDAAKRIGLINQANRLVNIRLLSTP
ncbi:lipoprotein [Beggiatoa alba B18LD]|uniref:Endolytic peptidoglycan transglycosylase RlpA n=1 Tax=Beggiatoa alba B18LD TaxID=395493 RepID=I3CCK3_9GAMM|nr:septal ring lytic transglycosylase RlpA family protein [Beggiatoa alba]EIJ41346.1 lipoprotein [Beggiatoa alba B18LD]